MSAFNAPEPPLNFRRDIRAFDIYHKRCTLAPTKSTTTHLFDAFKNDDAVNKNSIAYDPFVRRFTYHNDEIQKTHDKFAALWHFLNLKMQFTVLEDLLYGTADTNANFVSHISS